MTGGSEEYIDWWESPKGEQAGQLTALVQSLQDRQGYRRAADLHHLRMYIDRHATHGHRRAVTSSRTRTEQRPQPRLSLNVVRSCVDTAVAQITRARPRPQFLTTGGNWDLHQRAKKRGRFVESVFHRCHAYALGQRAFRDAALFGTGFLQVLAVDDTIQIERVPPNEVLVDDAEGVYGTPRNVFRARVADKLALMERFPGKARVIEDAPAPDHRYYGTAQSTRLALIVEAWHLPTSETSDDGRYAIAPYGADEVLYSGAYEHTESPFAVFRWSEDPFGWFGTGVAAELSGIQQEINLVLRTVQRNVYMGGNLKVFVPTGSIAKGQLTNDIGVMIETSGGELPSYVVNDIASPQLFQHLGFLIEQAYGITGISSSMAQAVEPERAESGRAKLVQRQTYSQRFLHVERQYENSFMDLANRVLDAAKDLAARKKPPREKYPGRWSVEAIRYEDVVLDDDDALMQVFPTTILPETPAGKIAMVESLEARGYIDRAQAMKLLDFPDVDAEMNLELAPIELIDRRIERMLDEGLYEGPHPRMDLELAMSRCLLAYQWAEERGCPPERLEVLGQFIDACQDMLAPAAAPAAPMLGAAMPGATPDAGMAPPAFPEQAPLAPMAPVAAA